MPAGWNLPTEFFLENASLSEQLRSKRLFSALLTVRASRSLVYGKRGREKPRRERRSLYRGGKLIELTVSSSNSTKNSGEVLSASRVEPPDGASEREAFSWRTPLSPNN